MVLVVVLVVILSLVFRKKEYVLKHVYWSQGILLKRYLNMISERCKLVQ